MVTGHCNSCVYFEDHKMMGICRRYPNYANRHSTEWCGEHKSAPKTDIQPEAKNVQMIIRKPGRPAKELQ